LYAFYDTREGDTLNIFAPLILLSLSIMWAIQPLTPEVYLTRKTGKYLETLWGGTPPYHVVGFIPIANLASVIVKYDTPSFWLFTYNVAATTDSMPMMNFFAGHETGHTICQAYHNYIAREHCADLMASYLAGYDAVLDGLWELGWKYPYTSKEMRIRYQMLDKARKEGLEID